MSALDKLKEAQAQIDALLGRKYKRRRNTGATEMRMKAQLAPELAKCIYGEPTSEEIAAVEAGISLHPATGYWRHTRADVQSFTGYIKVGSRSMGSIGSWDSMTKCLRNGFRVIDCRGERRSYADFELEVLS